VLSTLGTALVPTMRIESEPGEAMTPETVAKARSGISRVRAVVLPLFLVSGTAGLIYEVAWTRTFCGVFGNTVFAVSTVLAAFMLGLAVGSWLFGRIVDRTSHPLKLYALLELAIGVYAFLFLALLAATDHFYLWFYRSFNPSFYFLSLVRFVISIMILLIPTACMGGTLPVLSKLWASPSAGKSSQSQVGRSAGLLYAVNTFGAVLGSFLAGYFLMRLVGVSNTIYLAASANILVGAFALVLSRFYGGGQVRRLDAEHSKSARHRRVQSRSAFRGQDSKMEVFDGRRPIVLLAVAVAGFCALALEVLWTRVLVFVLGTSVYVFACMLSCFIFGLALGSLLCSRLIVQRIKRPIFALGAIEFLVALTVLGSVPLLGMLWHIDNLLTRKALAFGFWKEVTAHFIDTSVVLLVPTILMGMVFPIAVKICAKSWKAAGKRIGQVYAGNTVGCVAGSFMAGFVMVPLLGLRDSFLLVVAIQLFVATLVIFFSEKRPAMRGVAAAVISTALVIAAVSGIRRDVFVKTMNTHHYPSRVLYINDAATGTVTVHELPNGERLIAVDGVDVAGMSLTLRTTQKLQGYIPLLAHGEPQKVLQIGFGSGETSGVGLAFGVEDYRIAEICPAVFDAGSFFKEINRGSYKDPRLKKIIMDGKNFVKLTDETFDVIMNDSTYPGTTGSSALYTYDHFMQCRKQLRPGGMLSCWVPLDLRAEDLQIVIRSFQEAMPHSSLWLSNNSQNKHALLLGTMDELHIDFQRIKRLIERPDISADLAVINIHSVYDFLDCFVVDEAGLRRITGPGPLNTDDRPSLEFGAAIKVDSEGCFIDALTRISRNHSSVADHLVNLGDTPEQVQHVRETLAQYYAGTGHALRGLLGILQGDPDMVNIEFEMALKANPQDRDVQTCLEEIESEIRELVKAVKRTPTSATLRSRLAKRCLLLRRYEDAVEHYHAYVQLAPNDAAGWTNLGVCYNALHQREKAIWAFENAIRCDAGMAPAYVNLAGVHEKLGNLPAAVRAYRQAISCTSSAQRVYVYGRLAHAYFMQKEYALALDTLENALKLVPNDSKLREYLLDRKEHVTRAASKAEP
jgi:spermidine synthase